MAVLLVLLESLLVFRGLNAVGVEQLVYLTCRNKVRLGSDVVFTASGHFRSVKQDLVLMVPNWVPTTRGCFLYRHLRNTGRHWFTDTSSAAHSWLCPSSLIHHFIP
jgi:hypothetical protein